MGIPTLISTATASNASEVDITSGIDSTYDEYMFVFTDIGPATNQVAITFQCSIDGGSNYNVTTTSTFFAAEHPEAAGGGAMGYETGADQAQGTAYQVLSGNIGNGSDESGAGILHLFSPASTTYVKHFYSTTQVYDANTRPKVAYVGGYFNDTNDVNAISFKMASGNFDGVIQMYGIA